MGTQNTLPLVPALALANFHMLSNIRQWIAVLQREVCGLHHFGTEWQRDGVAQIQAPQPTQKIEAGRGKPVCPVNGR